MECTEACGTPPPRCIGCGVALCKKGRAGSQPRWCSACKRRRYWERHKATLYDFTCCGCGVAAQARGSRIRKLCDECRALRITKPSVCIHCGMLFKRKHKGGRDKVKYCGNRCAGAARSEKWRSVNEQKRLASLQKKLDRQAVRDAALERKASLRLCRDIASWAWEWDSEDRRKRIRRRKKGPGSKKHTTRAKKRGLPRKYGITLNAVGDRDEWICQLCGEAITDPSSRVGPEAPCIDHIVPLNHPENHKHGHVWDNVQVAHRKCNERKGCLLQDPSLLFADSPRSRVKSSDAILATGVGYADISEFCS
jgi:hypothetical protein